VGGEDAISFDDSAWPIVLGTCPVHMGDGSVLPLIAFFENVHARKERFVTLIDTRPLKTMPSAKWRREITAWASDPRVAGCTYRYNVATGVVVSSALTRGVFVALGWLRKPASPVRALGTMAEAAGWCGELLSQAGVPLGAKARALHDSLCDAGAGGKGSHGDRSRTEF
jgi:hypothetical protein